MLSVAHTPVPARARDVLEECPAREALDRLGDKWTPLVVALLADRPRRYGELNRLLEGVSARMLTLTLRRLERDGLVLRRVTPTIPPRVDYELSSAGEELCEVLAAVARWADRHGGGIRRSRADYDAGRVARPAPIGPVGRGAGHAVD
ncbi:winged helix-turn-helix transcriptional regulator [Kitasatospora sp. NPDC058201]|uniref:winged helix-turn-helix transcriptional regulator n=1 Tax=Kitasatospora sp. NPDC058201 TaxID=3346379 RepID=UPI0036DBACCC